MWRRRSYISLLVIVGFAILNWHCAGNMPLKYQQLQEKQTIKVQTKQGETIKGSITKIDEKQMVILTSDQKQKNIGSNDIGSITGPRPVYDESGSIISDAEIAAIKTRSHSMRYLLGGGALSFGVSFFLGSLIDRQVSDEEDQGPLMWGIAGAGTVVGATLFSIMGNKKDRQMAIEQIRDQRKEAATTDLMNEKERQRRLKDELKKLEKEREQQEKEMKELQEKMKDLE